MPNLNEVAVYEPGIYQLEITDPVQGGENGIDNLQAKQLANRTKWIKGQVDGLKTGSATYVADTGAVNPLVADFGGAFVAYAAGLSVRIKVALTNTGAATIALDGLAAKAIKKLGNIDLEAGDIVAGDIITLVYDGAVFQMLNPTRIIGRGRNLIINGSFENAMRGTNFVVNNTSIYTLECVQSQTIGSSMTVSRQAFAVGQVAVPGEPKFFMRSVVASVAGAGNFSVQQFKIEGVRCFAGKTVTLSFYAAADAARNIAISADQNFGTGGAPSAVVRGAGVPVAIAAGFRLVTVTLAIPSIVGRTIGSNGDDYLNFVVWFEAGATNAARAANTGQQSGTFDLALVSVVEGPVPYPYSYAGGTSAGDETLCRRQFRTVTLDERHINTVPILDMVNTYLLPSPMRSAPAVIWTDELGVTNLAIDTSVSTDAIVWRTRPELNGGWYWSLATLKLDAGLY